MLSSERNEQVCELVIVSTWINIRTCMCVERINYFALHIKNLYTLHKWSANHFALKKSQKHSKISKTTKTWIPPPRKSILTSICRLSIVLEKMTLQKHQKLLHQNVKHSLVNASKNSRKSSSPKMHVEVDNMKSECTR